MSLPGGWGNVWGRLWLTPWMGRAPGAEAGVRWMGRAGWWGRAPGAVLTGPWLCVLDPGQLHKPPSRVLK